MQHRTATLALTLVMGTLLCVGSANAMTKQELIEHIAKRTGILESQAAAAIDSFLIETVGSVPGERVNRPAFGSGLMELVQQPLTRPDHPAQRVRLNEGNQARVGWVSRQGHLIVFDAALPGIDFVQEGLISFRFLLPPDRDRAGRHHAKRERVEMELLLPPADVVRRIFEDGPRAARGERDPAVRIRVEIPARAFDAPDDEADGRALRLFQAFLPDLHPPLAEDEECGGAVLEAELATPGVVCEPSEDYDCRATRGDMAFLTDAVAKAAHIDPAIALDVIDIITLDGAPVAEDVKISGFGTFIVREKPARTGRNPFLGQPIKIPAKRTVRVTALKALKDVVQ